MRAVFASRNPHKLDQVRRLLPEVELATLDDVAPDLTLDEPFDTYESNALGKARAVVDATRLAAVADDSGLEVDALGGAPGVMSARYAGARASDEVNNRKLVEQLHTVPEEERTCRYRCVAAIVYPDGRELTAEGSCEGRVVLEGRGTLGFGYDPHVVPEGETRTMGEIPLDEKLRFSHRGRAYRLLAQKLAHPGSLDESDVVANPLEQFGKWLRDAIESQPGEPHAMTLATAARDGKPSARMVLLRGLDERGFVFYTNYESRKGKDLTENPQAALVFYWNALDRQVCITGRVTKLTSEESKRYFDSRPIGSRIGAWASHQSRIISTRRELVDRFRELMSRHGLDIPLPPYWGGYRVTPDTIEFWQGRPNRLHDRLRYTRTENDWVIERLSP